MQMYFSSREKARQASFGKLVDNGQQSSQGKRYAREIKAVSTGNKQSIACPITGKNVPVFVRGKQIV